ncbi:MAG: 8-amino-7-oxononanoate synthase [Chitinophagales bacterium]|nr:8-amino-7-oxononanoate synthase [Chitinophagales bacterium]MBP9189820.1 8-amino-7-oxononanoate synthase [Chitinophagales bacterium]MBP9550224.1 8-amino-7-oxononanoate synthase [Chitinophagales bacterium]MBP9797070.1 8-amino-7-oxononanoate synthase [Chitinophagales bacterium]
MDALTERLQKFLDERDAVNALRILKTDVYGIDFSSNDYLGFAQDANLQQIILQHLQSLNQFGSGGSRLLTGNNILVEEVEKALAIFHQSESALFFNSGYEANVGLISTVCRRGDLIVYDVLCHASLREGIQLSNAKSVSFAHNDLQLLEKQLQAEVNQKFIITESVFSMDGDMCPLVQIVSLAKKYNANIILDEAHGTGVIGEKGEGLAQHLNLHNAIFARVHTFGKAIGFNGAVVLGNAVLRNYLINFCKPFIYTTAPNMLQLVAVHEAYKYLNQHATLVKKLQLLIRHFNTTSNDLQLPCIPSDSAIHCLVIPGNSNVKAMAQALSKNGFDVRPILSPTVPAGTERLRICLHVFNTEEEITALLQTIKSLITP